MNMFSKEIRYLAGLCNLRVKHSMATNVYHSDYKYVGW